MSSSGVKDVSYVSHWLFHHQSPPPPITTTTNHHHHHSPPPPIVTTTTNLLWHDTLWHCGGHQSTGEIGLGQAPPRKPEHPCHDLRIWASNLRIRLYPLRIRQPLWLSSAAHAPQRIENWFHDILCGISGIWRPHTFQIYIYFSAEKCQPQSRPGCKIVHSMVQKTHTIHLYFLTTAVSVHHETPQIILPCILLAEITFWFSWQPPCKDVWHVLGTNPRSCFLHHPHHTDHKMAHTSS